LRRLHRVRSNAMTAPSTCLNVSRASLTL
jgi:hypothetical protein